MAGPPPPSPLPYMPSFWSREEFSTFFLRRHASNSAYTRYTAVGACRSYFFHKKKRKISGFIIVLFVDSQSCIRIRRSVLFAWFSNILRSGDIKTGSSQGLYNTREYVFKKSDRQTNSGDGYKTGSGPCPSRGTKVENACDWPQSMLAKLLSIDLFGRTHNGRTFFVQLKKNGKKHTPKQQQQQQQQEKARTYWICIIQYISGRILR